VDSETVSSATSPVEPRELAAWLAQGRDLLEDVRLSLDTRYPAESEEEKEEEDPEADTPLLRGIQIAIATFVPTFVVVFLGLPSLLSQAPAPPSVTPLTVSPGSPRLLSPSAAMAPERWPAISRDLLETRPVNGGWANDIPALLPMAPRRDDLEPKPVRSASADSVSWVRAAAFADESAAARLAVSMRSQGYRVDLRQDDSTTLPWVVWISKASSSPSGK
jgi:hypothetical protein